MTPEYKDKKSIYAFKILKYYFLRSEIKCNKL